MKQLAKEGADLRRQLAEAEAMKEAMTKEGQKLHSELGEAMKKKGEVEN